MPSKSRYNPQQISPLRATFQQTKKTLGKLRAEMRVIRTFAHSGKM